MLYATTLDTTPALIESAGRPWLYEATLARHWRDTSRDKRGGLMANIHNAGRTLRVLLDTNGEASWCFCPPLVRLLWSVTNEAA